MLLPTGHFTFFFFLNVDEQNLCGQILNSECFSSKGQMVILIQNHARLTFRLGKSKEVGEVLC